MTTLLLNSLIPSKQLGFLDRTPRGRVGTERAFEHFGVARRMRGTQNSLF